MSKINRLLLLVILGNIFWLSSAGQEEVFLGQKKLANCEITMRLTGKKKDNLTNRQFADSLKGVEIVWVYIDKETKKTKRAKPQRVYLISETLSSGAQVEYLVPADNYRNPNKVERTAIFPSWSATKANKYYRADCYDAAMKE